MPGIKPILLPLRAKNLTIEEVIPYLPEVAQQFFANQTSVIRFRQIYENQHDIASKERRYEDDSDINNQISTPHLWAMVNFKSGYALGNPKEYSQNETVQTDDIKYLNKYCKDVKMRSVDKDVITEVYTVGNCYYFVEPRDNLNELDFEYESPFNVWCRTSDTCAKVYSAYNGNEELFDILVTRLDEKSKNTAVSIYLPDTYYEFETKDSKVFRLNESTITPRSVYKKLPLVEKYANKSRIGIVEIGETIQNAIDKVYSNEVDNIEDLVNALLIFINTNLGETPEKCAETLKLAKKGGALALKDSSPDFPTDVKTINLALNHSDVLSLVDSLKVELYSACGVPLATSDTSNGNNKAGALQLGNGWENAYDRLLDEINSFIRADHEVLERMIFICKKVVNSRINKLNASEIDIKYVPNMSDNMQIKAQAYKSFIECNVPPSMAIAWTRLSNDPITQGKMIEEYADSEVPKTQNTTDSEVPKTQGE